VTPPFPWIVSSSDHSSPTATATDILIMQAESAEQILSQPESTTVDMQPLYIVPDRERVKQNQQSWRENWKLIVGLASLLIVGIIIIAVAEHRFATRGQHPNWTPYERALHLMSTNPMIDGHNDLAWQYRIYRGNRVWSTPSFDLRDNLTSIGLQTDLPNLGAGKVGGQFWSVYVRPSMPDAVRATMEQIDTVKSFVAKYSERFQLALTADDIDSAFHTGKIASLIGIEGGHQIDSSLAALRQFYELGARYMTLTHNINTPWSESCCDSADQHGPGAPQWYPTGLKVDPVSLTNGGNLESGTQVVAEMNRIGMMVDLSHVSANTMRDAIKASSAPVIFSHSAVYALVPHVRNVPDDVLDSLKENNGVLCITFYNNFTNIDASHPNNVSNIVDHFEYVRSRHGGSVAHLGIGSDFEGDDLFTEEFPEDLNNVAKFPNLIAELIARGWNDEEIIAIMGGNLKRVMRDVANRARQIQQEESTQSQPDECRLKYNSTVSPLGTCRSNF